MAAEVKKEKKVRARGNRNSPLVSLEFSLVRDDLTSKVLLTSVCKPIYSTNVVRI
jgi:hypothetical protein